MGPKLYRPIISRIVTKNRKTHKHQPTQPISKMKKTMLLIGLTMASLSTFAQGVIDFSWTAGSGIKVGAGSNPGSQQTGWYLGSDYMVQAYMASGAGAAESSLTAVAALKTTFLGGPT